MRRQNFIRNGTQKMPDWLNVDFVVSSLVWSLLEKGIEAIFAASCFAAILGKLFNVISGVKSYLLAIVMFSALFFILSILFFDRQQATPMFKIKEHMIAFGGQIDGSESRGIVVAPVLSIYNHGSAQSVADDWSGIIKYDGKEYVGDLLYTNAEKIVLSMDGNRKITLSNDDYLPIKFMKPLAVGDVYYGFMIFTFKNMDRNIFIGKNPTLVLSFADSFGAKHSKILTFSVSNDEMPYLPWLNKDRK